jgi:predicted small metal-binding protein
MAKSICCRDVGMDCDFTAQADTTEELMQKCSEHAKADHGISEIPPELAQKVLAAVRDV